MDSAKYIFAELDSAKFTFAELDSAISTFAELDSTKFTFAEWDSAKFTFVELDSAKFTFVELDSRNSLSRSTVFLVNDVHRDHGQPTSKGKARGKGIATSCPDPPPLQCFTNAAEIIEIVSN